MKSLNYVDLCQKQFRRIQKGNGHLSWNKLEIFENLKLARKLCKISKELKIFNSPSWPQKLSLVRVVCVCVSGGYSHLIQFELSMFLYFLNFRVASLYCSFPQVMVGNLWGEETNISWFEWCFRVVYFYFRLG